MKLPEPVDPLAAVMGALDRAEQALRGIGATGPGLNRAERRAEDIRSADEVRASARAAKAAKARRAAARHGKNRTARTSRRKNR